MIKSHTGHVYNCHVPEDANIGRIFTLLCAAEGRRDGESLHRSVKHAAAPDRGDFLTVCITDVTNGMFGSFLKLMPLHPLAVVCHSP